MYISISMTIAEAIRALVGMPHLVAFRWPGPQITLSRYNKMVDHQGPKPRTFVPCFNDVVSIDWQVQTHENFGKFVQQQIEAARAQRAAMEGESKNG